MVNICKKEILSKYNKIARAFDWRSYEYSKKAFAFSNTEAGFLSFLAWMNELMEKHDKNVALPGFEPTGCYWFNLGKFLQDNGMKPVPVNPHCEKLRYLWGYRAASAK